jgi:hypothetical protein
MKRALLSFLAIAFPLLLCSCSDHTASSAQSSVDQAGNQLIYHPVSPAKDTYSYTTPSGVVITPIIDKQPDEFADLLHVKYWRFDIKDQSPKNNQKLFVEWKNKKSKSYLGVGPSASSSPSHEQVLLVIAPLGDNWNSAEKMNIIMKRVPLDKNDAGISTSSMTVPNIVTKSNIMQEEDSSPRADKNGQFTLIRCWNPDLNKKGTKTVSTAPGTEDSALIFTVK